MNFKSKPWRRSVSRDRRSCFPKNCERAKVRMTAANFPRAFSKGRFRLADLVAARKVLTMTPDEQGDEQFYRDTASVAFPKLDDRQLSLLAPLSERPALKRVGLVSNTGY